MKVLGTPSKQDLEEFSKMVPFDQKLFNEFRQFKPANLKDVFFQFVDIDNLIDLLG
jgi:hypothetical protein